MDFTKESNEHEEKEIDPIQQKLHRRDTPHHLKNKRIINKNNDPAILDVRIFEFFGRIFLKCSFLL